MKFRRICLLVCIFGLMGIAVLASILLWQEQYPSKKFTPLERIIFSNRVSDFYEKISRIRTVGDTFAFVAKKDGKYFVVKGDEEDQRRYDEISQIEVYGEEIAFVAQKGTEWYVVYKDKEFGPYAPNVRVEVGWEDMWQFPLLVYDPQNSSRLIFFDRWHGKFEIKRDKDDQYSSDEGGKSSPPGPSAVIFDGVRRVEYDPGVHGEPHLLQFEHTKNKGAEKDFELISAIPGYGFKYKGKELVIEYRSGKYAYGTDGSFDYVDFGGKLLLAVDVDYPRRMAVWKED